MALESIRTGGAGRYVLVIGDAAMDYAVTASAPLGLCSACCAGSAVRRKRGGSARNVAENLARLGCDTRLMTVFGADEPGQSLLAETRQCGVDLSASLVCNDLPGSSCVIVSDHDGENYCCIGDVSLVRMLTPEQLASQQPLLRDAAVIVANTTLSEEALAWLFANITDQPVFFDYIALEHLERVRPWLSRIHTFRPGRDKARKLSGLPFADKTDACAVGDWFLRAGVRQIVLSLGEQGTYYSDGQQSGWLQRRPVQVVNATGAGDAMSAALVYGWITHMPLAETVRFALGAAALTLTTEENNHADLCREAVLGMMV